MDTKEDVVGDLPNDNGMDDDAEVLDQADLEEMIDLGDDPDAEEEADDEDESKEMQEKIAADMQDLQMQDDSVQGFFEHKDSVYSTHLNPADQTMCVSGDGNDQAYIWNVTDGKVLHRLTGHTDTVTNCRFSVDGKYVATGSMDATVRVYTTEDGALKTTLEGPSADIEWFCWHPKGPVIAAGSADSSVWVWNAVNGSCMRVFSGHLGPVICGTWTSCGKFLATGGEDCSLYVWSPKTGKSVHRLTGKEFHGGAITSIAAHPTEKVILTGSQDRTARLTNYVHGKVVSTYSGHTDSIESVGFCNTLKLASTGSLDGTLKIWDMSTGQTRGTCQHDEGLIKAEWQASGSLIFTGGLDKIIRAWDARTLQLVQQWQGHRDVILAMDIAKDGSFLVTGSDDNTALVFRRGEKEAATEQPASS